MATNIGVRGRRRGLLTVPAIAGIAFSVAWIIGLSVNSSSTDVHTPAPELLAAFTRHQGAALTQYVITEAVTSLLLVVVVLAVARRATLFAGAGVLAALVGLAEAGLGVWAAGPATSDGDASTVGHLVEAVNRLDGVKMLALAVMAAAGVLLARQRWMKWTGVALAVTITLSGLGYLFLIGTLSTFAYVSLPLLMLYITAAGIITGRAER